MEQAGENVLKNIRGLFKNTKHNLIEVGWLERNSFLELISKMDLSMQVSLTETFNIVAADSVFMGIPVVISNEIDWLKNGISDPNNISSMVKQMKKGVKKRILYIKQNLIDLKISNELALNEWVEFLK